jgi:hypothetical protein
VPTYLTCTRYYYIIKSGSLARRRYEVEREIKELEGKETLDIWKNLE